MSRCPRAQFVHIALRGKLKTLGYKIIYSCPPLKSRNKKTKHLLVHLALVLNDMDSDADSLARVEHQVETAVIHYDV